MRNKEKIREDIVIDTDDSSGESSKSSKDDSKADISRSGADGKGSGAKDLKATENPDTH